MPRKLTLTLIALSLFACAPGRIADLRDVAKLSLHGGLGFSVDARLGALTQPSFGLWSTSTGIGFETRDVHGVFFHKRISFPYSIAYLRDQGRPLGAALNATGWGGAFQVNGFQRAFEEIDRPLATRPPREFGEEIDGRVFGGGLREGAWLPLPDASRELPVSASFAEWAQLEAGGQGGIVGARIGFNPVELVDFLLGLAGLDIASDDARTLVAPEGEAD